MDGMDAVHLEELAKETRRQAGYDDDEIVTVTDVVTHCLGPDGVRVYDHMIGRAALVRVNDRFHIALRRGARDVRFAMAHELGHYVLRERARARFESVEREERAANTFAAALLAPTPLVTKAYSFFGEAHETIAKKLHLSQTATVLRLGEVRGDPRAVVTRSGHVFVRNQSAALDVEKARRAARRAPPGIARARLRGGIDEGRIALRSG
jgi:hypothetical protein